MMRFLYILRPAKNLSKLHIQNVTNFGKNHFHRCLFSTGQKLCTAQTLENKVDNPSQSNDCNISNEVLKGEKQKHEFQANTKALLDIVAKTLYSEKEVFLRELISNASDALEKLRYFSVTNQLPSHFESTPNFEIQITTDKQNRLLVIQDTGVGMTEEELTKNLGTIAQSGSKAFISDLKKKGANDAISQVIGQFGVGFYSAFMVADKVEVYTKSYLDTDGYYWCSDGSGSFEIAKADNVKLGTKIICHLRPDCREFSDETVVNDIIKKYSNFISSPISVNGKQVNTMKPLWLYDPNEVTKEDHRDFYRFLGNSLDEPRFSLHYITDVPLSIRAILYFPKHKSNFFDMNIANHTGISLYCKKVLIKNKMENILPSWLRFIKGVVDSEDIPLNLSRELLQNNVLISKVRNILTMRVLKFLQEKSNKEPEEYMEFYQDYHSFLKEGVITTNDDSEKENIAKILKFESSSSKEGEYTSFPEYIKRLSTDQKNIYYLTAPNRQLAEQSPYIESFKKRNLEVLFCYEPYDEVVLMHLRQFKNYTITSVEKDMASAKPTEENTGIISSEDMKSITDFIKSKLGGKAHEVKITDRLESHPCAITVADMPSARHFIRTQGQKFNDDMKYKLLQPKLEINVKHPLIQKLCKLRVSDPEIAELLINQLFMGSMIAAGLVEDSRMILTNMNELLTKILTRDEKLGSFSEKQS